MKPTDFATTTTAMRLDALLNGLVPDEVARRAADIAVTDISLDSRHIAPGGLFVALRGLRSHGLQYARQAVAQGAAVVLWEADEKVDASWLPSVPAFEAVNLSAQVGAIADRFFGRPSAALKIAAVTGTNGKTTTASLLAAAAEVCGVTTAYAGTVGFGRLGALRTAGYTTPDCITLHRQFAELRDSNVDALAMEVSSHALAQGRIDAARIDTAAFTNLTRDHLDFHGALEAYGAAKAKLLQWPGLRHRVLNAGDAFGKKLLAEAHPSARTTAYSIGETAELAEADRWLRARQVTPIASGIELHIESSWGECTLRSRLLGGFNAENLLAALAVLLGWDIPLARAAQALEQAPPPPGRMEVHTDASSGRRAVIDYAHTPDALEKALRVLRRHCSGKLICVFGCGGDRDPGKRPMMGAVAERCADALVVTDDNPRSESPAKIVADILAGLAHPERAHVEHDRAKAIREALTTLGHGDLALIAGKGHEDYQLIGGETRYFSDRDVVLECFAKLAGGNPA